MDLSIMIPVYNQAKYISQTIDSVLNNGFNGTCEIVIVNDGSTDSLKSVLNQYLSRNIRLVEHDGNKGLPAALNTCVMHTRSKYLTWISADSYYEKGTIQKLYNELENDSDLGLVCSDFVIFGEGQENQRWCANKTIITYEDMLKDNFVRASFMYRYICHEVCGLYDEELRCVEDYDMWIRVSKEFKVKHICGAPAYWRNHSENLSNSFCRIHGQEYMQKMREKHGQ